VFDVGRFMPDTRPEERVRYKIKYKIKEAYLSLREELYPRNY